MGAIALLLIIWSGVKIILFRVCRGRSQESGGAESGGAESGGRDVSLRDMKRIFVMQRPYRFRSQESGGAELGISIIVVYSYENRCQKAEKPGLSQIP